MCVYIYIYICVYVCMYVCMYVCRYVGRYVGICIDCGDLNTKVRVSFSVLAKLWGPKTKH